MTSKGLSWEEGEVGGGYAVWGDDDTNVCIEELARLLQQANVEQLDNTMQLLDSEKPKDKEFADSIFKMLTHVKEIVH